MKRTRAAFVAAALVAAGAGGLVAASVGQGGELAQARATEAPVCAQWHKVPNVWVGADPTMPSGIALATYGGCK